MFASAFVLVGPTAVGKTAVAHHLALGREIPVLSADSMLVYRGMDVGTAKPSAKQRSEVSYLGLDLVTPDRDFSVAEYLDAARLALADAPQVFVTGGTGLYVKCLLEGLDAVPPANEALRKKVEGWTVEQLQRELQARDPRRYEALADKQNPRRLIRALEQAEAGRPDFQSLEKSAKKLPILGISMERGALDARIRARVHAMFDGGLLDEAKALRAAGPLSKTARQAIGYAEAFAVLDGTMDVAAAMAAAATRTRQLAKRQMTWFRHQANVDWINATPDMTVEEIAHVVDSRWQEHGPNTLQT